MKKIGISASLTIDKSSRFKNYKIVKVADNYVQTIANLNAMPFVLPIINNELIIEEQVKSLDALILSGGEDINPVYYREKPLSKLEEFSVERDKYDFTLAKYALQHNIPVLGICRGAQILNVILGGSLYQDHSYISKKIDEHNYTNHESLVRHEIFVEKDTFIHKIFGEKTMVNSFHHQSVKNIAPNLRVTAFDKDGIVEAFESRNKNKLILGIQWHPEMMANKGNNQEMIELFRAFINYEKPLRIIDDNINKYNHIANIY